MRNEPQVLVALSEEQLNRLKDVRFKDDGKLLFSSSVKDNVKSLSGTDGEKSVSIPGKRKEQKWWEPTPEYYFNWKKFRFEEMSEKKKDQQFWLDFFCTLILCLTVIGIVKSIESYGMDGRDRFFELVSGEKFNELGKTNIRRKPNSESMSE